MNNAIDTTRRFGTLHYRSGDEVRIRRGFVCLFEDKVIATTSRGQGVVIALDAVVKFVEKAK